MRRSVVVTTLVAAVYGCASPEPIVVTPHATGGSKANGTVEMTYEYYRSEEPKLDRKATEAKALERCRVWGYDGAEAFDAVLHECLSSDNYGCIHFRGTLDFQCTNTGGQTEPTSSATNFREELRQIQESMSCMEGAKITEKTAESVKWELNCGDGETLQVRCFEDDCYLR